MYNEDIVSFSGTGDAPFFVSMCGISYCDGTYHITRKSSGISVLEYIVSGTGTVRHDATTFEAGRGDVYFLKEGSFHDYYSDAKNPWVKIWFNFKGELASEITRCLGLEKRHHFHAPELKEAFEQVYRIASSGRAQDDILCEIGERFFGIAQRLARKITEEEQQPCTVASRLKGIIDGVTDFGVGLDELIKPLFCTKSHAIREFKGEYGITPYEYLQRKRTALAKELLKNTAMPVCDIAGKLGFYDIHYFSGVFKRRTGKTPTQYRRG